MRSPLFNPRHDISRTKFQLEVQESVIMQPSPWDDDAQANGDSTVPQDSAVGGDAHTGDAINTFHQTIESPQPQSIIVGMPQGTISSPYQQMYPLQPHSSASKIVGIFVIILGVFSVLGIFGAFLPQVDLEGNPIESSGIVVAITALNSLAASVFFLVGGIWMTQYKRKGVHLVLLGVGFTFVLGMVAAFLGGDAALASMFGDDAAFAIQAIGNSICSVICGAIVAIPLMNGASSGLDDSRLF